MKKNMTLWFACGWFGLTGYGATHYADRTRPDDSGDGKTWATAKRTLQAAVDLSVKGDTVLVAPGIYAEGLRVTPGGWLSNRVVVTKDITLASRDGAKATVILGARDPADATYQGCGSNAVRCVYMAAGTLKGFTLAGGASGSENKEDLNNRGGGLYAPTINGIPEISDCIVSNNAAIRGGGAYAGTLRRCRVIGNRAQKNGAGVRDSTLHDCIVAYNAGSGAAFSYAKPGWRDNGVFNCTVAYNTGAGLEHSSAFNTISVGNGSAFSGAVPENTFVNCCLSSAAPQGSNNIVAAYARFADPAAGDFRLLSNSPCLDAGNPAFPAGAPAAADRTDCLGAPRVQGKGLDIGAVEGVVPDIAAVACDTPQGAGTFSPAGNLLLTALPTQLVFTAAGGAGAALRHFTLDGEALKKRGNTFTLNVARPGGYTVSAVFQKALPWDPRLPEAEVASEPSSAEAVEGRIENQPALRIEEGALGWSCRDLGQDYFIEFWLQPVAWRATGGDAAELCRLTLGTDTYVLTKVAGKSNLALALNGEALQVYPVYGWDDADWAKAMPRKLLLHRSVGWHHVNLTVSGKRLRLAVDGFPAREVKQAEVRGPLKNLTLSGNPGTTFTLPLLARGGTLEPAALRRRFLALFLNQTQMMPQLLTAPRLKTPPAVDGRLDGNEWSGAARINGWVTVAAGQLLTDDSTGYIGYDNERLYLAVVTPCSGRLPGAGPNGGAAGQAAGLDLFLGPPFISGETPRRLLQFSGALSGGQSQRQVLPVSDDQWRGAWLWSSSVSGSNWVAEFSARFEDIGLPKPAPGETWTINLVNRLAGTAWSQPEGGTTNAASMAELQFDPQAPVIRPGDWTVKDGKAAVTVELSGGRQSRQLTAGIQLYGGSDLLPSASSEQPVNRDSKGKASVELEVPVGTHPYGRLAVYVKDGKKFIYFHSASFPKAKGGSAE